MMVRLIRIFFFYVLLIELAVGLLVGNLACLPLILLPIRLRQRLMQRLISGFLRLFLWSGEVYGVMQLDLKNLDQLNSQSRLILVANHPSMIDVFLIISRLRQTACLMKASISSNLFLGIGAHLAGYVSNRRVDQALRQAIETVNSGGLLLTFPEGTRTIRQPVNEIKPGFALIAKRSEAPIQAILIQTNSEYLSQGWKIWRLPPLPMVYKAVVGEKMYYSINHTETAENLKKYFEKTLNRSIDPAIQITR
jgi:1-acyl-sn-glycerol-3-phosphate acyltransferase